MSNLFNVIDMLDRAALTGGRDATVSWEGRSITTTDLADRARRLASGLRARGIGHGDRVAVLMGNRPEWLEVFFGLAHLGAICVPVNVLLKAPEVQFILDDSDADCIVVDQIAAETLALLTRVPATVVAVGSAQTPPGAHLVSYEDVVAQGMPTTTPGGGMGDPLVYYYTSGTTGAPKAAVHTNATVMWNAFHHIPDLGLTAQDIYLVVPSLSWAAGISAILLPLLWTGGSVVLMGTGNVTPERIVDHVETSGATRIMLAPTLLRQLAQAPDLQARLRRTRLTWSVTGAEPVQTSVLDALREGVPAFKICEGYGLSEFPTVASVLQPDEAASHVGSCGRASAITKILIQEAGGEIVSAGAGEVLIRSPATTAGYLNRPEANRETFVDGWLHTGDLGELDEQGFLRITGRKKDTIISGGLNITPGEVEAVLQNLPRVVEAAVIGVPDETWGEVPAAIVVVEPGGPAPEQIRADCRQRLANYKCPRHVLISDEPLPRNVQRKLLRRELRPWAIERLGQSAPPSSTS